MFGVLISELEHVGTAAERGIALSAHCRFRLPIVVRSSSKNVASKVDRFTSHKEVDEFKSFCIDAVGRIGFGQDGSNQDIVDQTRVLFENEMGEIGWVILTVRVSELVKQRFQASVRGREAWEIVGSRRGQRDRSSRFCGGGGVEKCLRNTWERVNGDLSYGDPGATAERSRPRSCFEEFGGRGWRFSGRGGDLKALSSGHHC
ncbi:hypothetical protein Cgig2_003295 [Carnegiea gigantea]|uniref:Uncharacterized protein n=1 Tax=Carnegiea gigantea TaxID=171969 RepID=A0A9Q1JQ59_9CARY|nr:hypothetical protein Cgig2_003295 [Carnegiea gigantea]